MFSHDVISVQLWQGSTKRKKDLTKTMLGAVIADYGPGDIWGSDRNMAFVAAAASTTVHAMVIIFCPPLSSSAPGFLFLGYFFPPQFLFYSPEPPTSIFPPSPPHCQQLYTKAHFIGEYTISVANRTSKVLCSMRRRRSRSLLIRSGADSDIAVIETQAGHPMSSIKVKQFSSREHHE